MTKSSEIILYEPFVAEWNDELWEVYRCVLPDVRGKNGTRHWYYPYGTSRDYVEADLLDYFKRNDAIWQLRLPGDIFQAPELATNIYKYGLTDKFE